MRRHHLAIALIGFSLAVPVAGAAADAGSAAASPAAVVEAMNAAITARDLPAVKRHFAPGGVQFSLRPAHTGLGAAASGLTTPLDAHWSMIGPVLFGATQSYQRQVEVLDARVEGDVATVWTRTRTRTVRGTPPVTKQDEFVEIYLMVRTGGEWKVGAIADNRRPNDVGLGGQ
jgi:hypothetical protein